MNCEQLRRQLDDLTREGVRAEPDDFKEHRLSCAPCREYCEGFYHALEFAVTVRQENEKRTFTTYEAALAEDTARKAVHKAIAKDEVNRGAGMSLEESRDATWEDWNEAERLWDVAAFAWDHVVFSPEEKAFFDAEEKRLHGSLTRATCLSEKA
jgi:hypothetical protein